MRLVTGRKLTWWLGAAAVVAAIAVVAVGVPAYNERARHDQLAEAFRNLSEIRTWMDSYHQHHKTYARGDVCGASVVPPDRARYFSYACALDTTAGAPPGQSYAAIATGSSSHTAGFRFSIDQKNNRATVSIPPDWEKLPADARTKWVERKP